MAAIDVMSDSGHSFMLDEDSESDFEIENIPPPKQKSKVSGRGKGGAKKKPQAPKKNTKKTKNSPVFSNDSDDDDMENSISILGERDLNENTAGEAIASSSNGGNIKSNKTVEQIYQKKTQLEHILLRPDTYIGSVERVTQPMFVLELNDKDGEGDNIIEKEITYTPGLYKIYDEILVNAADNKQRDPNMDKLDIVVDAEANLVSVKNNGAGIPVVMHSEHKCYVPTLIFGHLLTGSNFDDDEKKTTGGRNGYGAKLANIFSKRFVVECLDSKNGLKFHQIFRDNMTIAESPTVKKCTAAEKKKGDYVKIAFSPDLNRFKMSDLEEDTVGLLSKRAYDIAGSMANRPGKKLVVTLNGKKLSVRNFQGYLKLYKDLSAPVAYELVGDRWEVGLGVSDGSFQQISFVNSICTSKGGQHVSYIADQVGKELVKSVNKKNKGGLKIKENTLKNYFCVYLNCLIENPAFDSQTKECMTTRKNAFGSTCKLSDKFIKAVEKSGVVDKILAFAKFKQSQELQKKGGTKKIKLTGIAKLDDANHAGSAKSKDCTLILTEGDSAKSLAMSGLSVVGRDYYGVFPLKGKPLNVREATHKQIMDNEEIKNLVNIMGLKFGTVYNKDNIKTLRYGHLMIMADQDHDGSHIKGLVINFIHHFWPSLLNVSGFLQQFITPIVKATKRNVTKTFFTLPEYNTWKASTGNDAKGWVIKYYKGLGTSTSAEAKDYFSNLDLHEIHFSDISHDECRLRDVNTDEPESDDEMDFDNNEDDLVPDKIVSGSKLIEMAFAKKHVEDRKLWLNNLKKNTFLNYSRAQESGVKYSEFINKELILFSQADNQRSIPHAFDGFKPSQRKVLFACFLKNLKTEMKVAQLCGYVGEKSAYHHGEASLAGTIVNMAQDFVGSNNINLLTPAGQFGTRRMGGKDSASPRYIFTRLEKITRTIFHPDDDPLLTYLNDDGQSIEPEFYMPVIPMVLVNGAEGIGTGWSTNVPNYNPRDIIANIRRLINGEGLQKMTPFFYGFTGEIEADDKSAGSYNVRGKIERKDDTTLFISELPLKTWTQNYKVFLESMMASDTKKEPELKDFKENHTDTTVSFTVTATKEKIDEFELDKKGIYGKFKLTSKLSTENMNLFDQDGRIIKYSSPEDILTNFYQVRFQFYIDRKEHLLKILRREHRMLSNKARFVEEVCSGDLVITKRKRKELLADLKERNYDLFPKEKAKTKSNDQNEAEDSDIDDNESDAELAKGYEYLLGMKIWSLTLEKANQLRKELAEKTKAVEDLEATPVAEIWKKDLTDIEEALDDRDLAYEAAAKEEFNAQKKNKKRFVKKKGKTAKKKSSDSDESDADFLISKKPAKKKTGTSKSNASKANESILKATSVEGGPESDSDVEISLADRMKKKLAVSPKPKKVSKPKTLDTYFSSSTSSRSTTAKAGTKRVSPRTAGVSSLESICKTALDDVGASSPAPKRSKSLKARKKKETTSKKKVVDTMDDTDEDDIFDDEEMFNEDTEAELDVPAPTRARRGRKPVTYVVDSDSDF